MDTQKEESIKKEIYIKPVSNLELFHKKKPKKNHRKSFRKNYKKLK